jgi:hypothetical protein
MARTKEQEKARNKEYWYNNRWAKNIQMRYGITQEQYEEMLSEQNGGCAICGITEATNGRRLAVDHDHQTGEVRGLLCNNCNVAVGIIENSKLKGSDLIGAIYNYLRW